MGNPVTLNTSVLTSPIYMLNQARKAGYVVILSAPELNIQRCNTINPAAIMVLPIEGTPNDCIECTDTKTEVSKELMVHRSLIYQQS